MSTIPVAVGGSVGPQTPEAGRVELNGINVIDESERRGKPSDLFWPWFAANISVFGISYGAFLLENGISLGQAIVCGLLGVIISFLLCGFVALAGKRVSAPTLIASRAVFGVEGNKLPTLVSYVLTVGWETVLTALATLGTAAAFDKLGWGGGDATKLIALLVVVVLIIGAGVLGFDTIMRMQTYITIITGILTVAYIVIVWHRIDWHTLTALHGGSTEVVLGSLVLALTGFGLGWVNTAADYSRYLPRSASSAGVVGWTSFGAMLAPLFLIVFGIFLAGSLPHLTSAIGGDPIGALLTLLPTWFLIPFAVVAVLGLVGGAVLDIYSSGLALLTLGIPIPRWSAALVDGVIMIAGTIYIVFYSDSFLGIFQGFLITLGVPIAAWCGQFLGDLAVRRGDYSEADLYDGRGRYGYVRVGAVLVMIVATVVGWGLVTSSAAGWLEWEGYLLRFGLGGKTGAWEYAGLGVLVALVIGFVAQLVISSVRLDAVPGGRRREGHADPRADPRADRRADRQSA